MEKKLRSTGHAPADDEVVGYTIGAENPFAGRYPPGEAEIKLLRLDLPIQFEVIIRYYGWTQAEAAAKFGVPQPRISELLHRKYDNLSLETMIGMAARVGIVLRPRLPAGMPDSLPDGWPQPAVPVRRKAAKQAAERKAPVRRRRRAAATA